MIEIRCCEELIGFLGVRHERTVDTIILDSKCDLRISVTKLEH